VRTRNTARIVLLSAAIGGCSFFVHHSYNAQALGIDTWRAVEINGHTVAPEDIRQRPWLHFAVDAGQVNGNTGCNSLSGPLSVDGSLIKMGTFAMTRVACVNAVMDAQETEFVNSLNVVNRWMVSGDTLILLSGSETKVRLGR